MIKTTEFNEGDVEYSVYVNGNRVFCDLDCRASAIRIAQWWVRSGAEVQR